MKDTCHHLAKRWNRRRNRIASAAAFGMAYLGQQSAPAATTLTGLDVTNELVPMDHGSRAEGTPNIVLEWSGTNFGRWDQYAGWPGDTGDGVYQLDGFDGDSYVIKFIPDVGWNVAIAILDLNVWVGGGDTDVDWEVVGSVSGSLGDGSFSTPDDSVVQHLVNVTGSFSETLTFTLFQTSGAGSYLALDNLIFEQVPAESVSCDFDGDGLCGVSDIDQLMSSVAAGNNDRSFDLNNDAAVTDADRDEWLGQAATENGFAAPYLVGDSNLDGSINASDLNALALKWQTTAAKWSEGNYTGGNVDAQDLNAMALNWQKSISAAASASTVPEPGTGTIAVIGLGLGATMMRRRRPK